MLVRFNNEVLRQGVDAAQPQNLTAEWLDLLHDEAKVYLCGRTDRRYILLALIASRALARDGLTRTVSGIYDLAQLDRYVRDYAQRILEEKAQRLQMDERQSV